MNDRLRGLYGITDPQLQPDTATLMNSVEAALRGGMRVLQYRAKQLSDRLRLEQACSLRELCRQYEALFIINDHVPLAIAVEADGVHLGSDDSDIPLARENLGSSAIIGCSCYDRLELAIHAQQQGADYVAFGRFFPSLTKPQATPADLSLLPQARTELSIPICAIGGITTDNAEAVAQSGADMLAVIHDLFARDDIENRARQFQRLFGSIDRDFCVE